MKNKNRFCNKYKDGQVIKLNIAHNEGNYFTNPDHMKYLEDKELIAFKYCNEKGETTEDSNPNGSQNSVAGIFNDNKNILGMMPHPERMISKFITSEDGVNLFSSLLK